MYKTIIVVIGVVAAALAKPGILNGYSAVSPLAATTISVGPSAVSQQSRADIINPGVVALQSAAPVLAAPITSLLTAAPLGSVSSAVTSQLDVSQPVSSIVGTPLAVGGVLNGLATGYGITNGLGVGGLAVGATGLVDGVGLVNNGLGLVGHGYGR